MLPPTVQLLRALSHSPATPLNECFGMTAAAPPVLLFWMSHLVATLLASATAQCGSSGRTPLPDGGDVGVHIVYALCTGCGGYGSAV